jgi:CxxC motif-containing protein
MPESEIICIGCPLGCRVTLKITNSGDITDLVGNQCKEGTKNVTAEYKAPVRVFTSTIFVDGDNRLLPVRTDRPVPKHRLKEIMSAVADMRVKRPVKIGQEIVHNILGTNANLIASGKIETNVL